MKVLTKADQWFDEIVSHNEDGISESRTSWLNQMRQQARGQLASKQKPSPKDEAWRYTNMDAIYANDYQHHAIPLTALDDDDIDSWVFDENESYRLVFANGHCVPALSNIHILPNEIKLGGLRAVLTTDPELVAKWVAKDQALADGIFKELNTAFINDGLFLHVPENVEVDKPIEVVYLNLSLESKALCQPRSLVVLEPGSRARLVERYISTGDSAYLFNGVNELYLGDSASLEHYRIQSESKHAFHLSDIKISQDKDSEYHAVNIATGASWNRTQFTAQFDGEHAVCNLNGLYTVDDNQYTDFHLDIRHNLPACQSRENFRGIAYGAGRAVFDGKIVVEKGAQKTDAQLSNKNLLLTKDAEIDTKPQLEIYADDVKCSHGTTVGQIDPNQLYYLQSRGIAKDEAYKMLCLGFAEQVLEQVKDYAVHEFIREHIAGLLSNQEAKL